MRLEQKIALENHSRAKQSITRLNGMGRLGTRGRLQLAPKSRS